MIYQMASARSEPIEFRESTNIAEYIRNNPNIHDLMMDLKDILFIITHLCIDTIGFATHSLL